MATSYTMTIDQDACLGCALCEGLFKKYFQVGSDGKAKPKQATISEEEYKTIKEAMESCPASAIHVKKK
jgi:ferredoxin